MIISDRLRALREEKNLSQGNIEKRTGLIRCYVSRVENNQTALRDIEELIAIGVVEQEEAGGRSTSYRLKKNVEEKTGKPAANKLGDL